MDAATGGKEIMTTKQIIGAALVALPIGVFASIFIWSLYTLGWGGIVLGLAFTGAMILLGLSLALGFELLGESSPSKKCPGFVPKYPINRFDDVKDSEPHK